MKKLIATSTDRMQSDIDSFIENLERMEQAFSEAWEAVDALHSTWEGPAHTELVNQFLQDQEGMKSMMIDLRNYREELEFAKKEYATCESNVCDLMNKMNV